VTFDELLGDFVVLLRAQLSCPVIEGQRVGPPAITPTNTNGLRVMVYEGDAGVEAEWAVDLDEVSGGSSFYRMHLACTVEIPWDEDEATMASINAAVETIIDTVQANRDIDADDSVDAAVGRFDGWTPFMATYPGHPESWIKGRTLRCSWRV
jgi:hypothetical protein